MPHDTAAEDTPHDTAAYDVAAVRAAFPSLASGIAHFDGPGGTQTPAVVAEAIARTLTLPLSNRGTGARSERNADEAVSAYRAAVADLVGGDPRGVVHGRSATQLTYDLSRALAKGTGEKPWGPGDEVVVTELDHDANVRPWIQAAEALGATVRWLRLDPATADLDLTALDEVVTERTRLVAVAGASNLLGTMPEVARIAARAHAVGALVHVDAVHLAAHAAIDLASLGADLLVLSPYKLFGPHCAALVADPALLETIRPDKLAPSTDAVPERFELGTLPYELLAGVTAAIDFLASLGAQGGSRRERILDAHARIHAHELRLRGRVEEGLRALGDRLVLHSVAAERTPTLFLTPTRVEAGDAYRALLARDLLVPAGSFYAQEPFRALGTGAPGGLRIGLAAYTDDAEVDRLLAGLEAVL